MKANVERQLEFYSILEALCPGCYPVVMERVEEWALGVLRGVPFEAFLQNDIMHCYLGLLEAAAELMEEEDGMCVVEEVKLVASYMETGFLWTFLEIVHRHVVSRLHVLDEFLYSLCRSTDVSAEKDAVLTRVVAKSLAGKSPGQSISDATIHLLATTMGPTIKTPLERAEFFGLLVECAPHLGAELERIFESCTVQMPWIRYSQEIAGVV